MAPKTTALLLGCLASSAGAATLRGTPQMLSSVDCSAAADQSAWDAISGTMSTDVNDCAGLSSGCVSILKGVNQECVSKCMEDKKSFSSQCSPAFGTLADCGFKNCKAECINGDPNAESCVTCNEQKCSPAFHESTGFEVQCVYEDNCNGDSAAVTSGDLVWTDCGQEGDIATVKSVTGTPVVGADFDVVAELSLASDVTSGSVNMAGSLNGLSVLNVDQDLCTANDISLPLNAGDLYWPNACGPAGDMTVDVKANLKLSASYGITLKSDGVFCIQTSFSV